MLEAGEKIKLGSVSWTVVQSKRKNELKGSVKGTLKINSKL